METMRFENFSGECERLLADVVCRLKIEEPEMAATVQSLCKEVARLHVGVLLTQTARILVPRLTPSEVARLHMLMGSPPLE